MHMAVDTPTDFCDILNGCFWYNKGGHCNLVNQWHWFTKLDAIQFSTVAKSDAVRYILTPYNLLAKSEAYNDIINFMIFSS